MKIIQREMLNNYAQLTNVWSLKVIDQVHTSVNEMWTQTTEIAEYLLILQVLFDIL